MENTPLDEQQEKQEADGGLTHDWCTKAWNNAWILICFWGGGIHFEHFI